LTIIPAEDPSKRQIISLVRDEITLDDQAAKAKIIELPDGKGHDVRLGVLDLPSFYAAIDLDGSKKPELTASEHGGGAGTKTTQKPEFADNGSGTTKITTLDVARLLKKLEEEKVSGVILDLRGNGGGLL